MTDAYTALARCYDRLTADVDYGKWADYVERHFRAAERPVRRVAELGCGTGSLTRLLARRGYEMTAVDLSPDMLAVADQKCAGLGVRFVCQDMSRLALLEPADAVLSCLDSVNYVTRPAALRRTFQRAHQALAPRGAVPLRCQDPRRPGGGGRPDLSGRGRGPVLRLAGGVFPQAPGVRLRAGPVRPGGRRQLEPERGVPRGARLHDGGAGGLPPGGGLPTDRTIRRQDHAPPGRGGVPGVFRREKG